MDALVLRPYQPRDAAACAGLFEELFDTHRQLYDDPTIGSRDPRVDLRRHLRRAGARDTWVATLNGRVVGFLGLESHRGYGEVEPIVVAKGSRQRGVARLLLSQAIREARRRHWRRLAIRPVARNATAIRVFYRSGFVSLGQLELDLWLKNPGKPTFVPVAGPVIAGRRFSV